MQVKSDPVFTMIADNVYPSVSIIIPTFNEEGNIGSCLKAVFGQSYQNVKEVIIADNQSTDKTRMICRDFPVQIVDGGKPAAARNRGVAAASCKILLFLDADTIIARGFLQKALTKYYATKTGIASFFLEPRPESIFMRIIFTVYNIYGWLASRVSFPVFNTAGCCLLIKRSLHESVNGFDEGMIVLEEYDYIRRIKAHDRFRVLPLKVSTSTRRFGEGRGVRKTIILFGYYFKWLLGKKITEDNYGYWN